MKKKWKLLFLIPYIGMLGGIYFANRVEPYILGLPFLLFWVILWTILCSVIMAIIYKLDPANKEGDHE